jgi:hypothetical protein
MYLEIINIIAGLILAAGVLPSIPAIGKGLGRLAKWLGGFQTIIGIITLIAVFVFGGFSLTLQPVVALIAGLVLLTGILHSVPLLGRFVKWLGGFQTIIGVIALIVGILGLLV